jgi:hypothetical protein
MRTLGQKQRAIATAWVGVWNTHAVASMELVAETIEGAGLRPRLWLRNAWAFMIESVGATFDACSGVSAGTTPNVTQPGSTPVQSRVELAFRADADAECAGPRPLVGVSIADLPLLVATDLIGPKNAAHAREHIKLKGHGNAVDVMIEGLLNGVPLTTGSYRGAIERRDRGETKVLTAVVLERT